MVVSCITLCCLALVQLSRTQGPYPDGDFTFPPDLEDQTDQATFLRWTEGTVVTVSWNSTYQRNNLYYAQFGDDAESQALVGKDGLTDASSIFTAPSSQLTFCGVNTEDTQFAWTVKGNSIWPNRSIPFHFRVVNPDGSEQDQTGGGFWSAGFFILAESSITSSSLSTSSSAIASLVISTGTPALTSLAPSATIASPQSTSASPSASSPPSSGSTVSKGGIAGIVFGSLAALGICGALFYWYGHRRAVSKEAKSEPQAQYQPDPKHYSNPSQYYFGTDMTPVEVLSERKRVEMDGSKPDGHPEPVELG